MQTSYPVFENGQVLSASHLNDLAEYLEEQDRLTRNKLIGIGIACGLDVSYRASDDLVRVSRGAAVTSEGYLIVHEETFYDRFRPYTLPVPEAEEAPDELVDGIPYPLFFNDDGEQIELFELLSTEFEASDSDDEPDDISSSFVADKVALIFLEHNLESLKNCDINDCSDRGSEVEFTARVLVVSKEDAQRMLDREEEIAQRPVHRGMHPAYELEELRIAKLRLAANGVDSFAEFVNRIHDIAADFGPRLSDSLRKSYEAFKYLLQDGYPADSFSDGPFADPNYFGRLVTHATQNIVLCQYFYGYMVDVTASYNEFLRAAIALEAECCPNTERFPLHVLLGEVVERPTAFAGDPLGSGFDPLQANTGFSAARPIPFRHHFIPSPLFGRHHGGLMHVRSLHYRTYLLAYRYSTDDLFNREIRITPSKSGDVDLSDQAIPFYYALGQNPGEDDLARNWSFSHASRNRLDRIFSYQYINTSDHPFLYRMDGHDFYRVEGVVGKGLGEAMRTILQQKRSLGLSFGIEPVFIGLAIGDDQDSLVLERQARESAREVLMKLIVCRMRELDVLFLVMMSAIFQYIVAIITLLSRTNTSAVAGLSEEAGRAAFTTRRSVRDVQIERELSGLVLKDLRGITYERGFITRKMTTQDDPAVSLGSFYEQVREAPSTENLFDRTLKFTRQSNFDNPDEVARKIYPSISLLDKAEELAAVTTTASLADLDVRDFEVRYDGFVQAFEAYLHQQPEEEAPQLRDIRQQLSVNYGGIAATAPQSVLSGLVGQLRERMNGIFGELLLGNYALRHPGAEHKGGVHEGGTLVLLYTHRSFIARLLKQHTETFERRAGDVASRFEETLRADVDTAPTRSRRITLADPELILAPRATNPEPLDDFVVVGDLCLPYMCCDTDCSDIELAEEEEEDRPGRQPGTVRGTIVLGEATADTINVAVLDRASVSVVNEATREAVDVNVSGGTFEFTAPPGTFRISVRGPRGVEPVERLVTVRSGGEITEDVVLRRRR